MDAGGTVIVGAGLVGSAVAMHLAEMGRDGVVVVDPDLAGGRSSSELNAGGVRATWWQPVNVELCAATIDFIADHRDELGFRQQGYLWLHGPWRWEAAVSHVEMQNGYGREVELLTAAEVARRWPEIDLLDGIAGATFSPRDGLVSPGALREHYRARARAAGARFVDRRMVVGARRDGGRITALALARLDDPEAAARALEGGGPGAAAETMACETVVNAAGPWAAPVADILGAPVPCRAVPRQLCVVACRDVDLSGYGMIVDTSDLYLHHEAGDLVLAGYSPPDDPPSYRFDYEGEAFFEREIWPRLAARMSGFDRAGHVRGWTGLYELSPDHSALLGAVAGLENAYEIHSFLRARGDAVPRGGPLAGRADHDRRLPHPPRRLGSVGRTLRLRRPAAGGAPHLTPHRQRRRAGDPSTPSATAATAASGRSGWRYPGLTDRQSGSIGVRQAIRGPFSSSRITASSWLSAVA